MSRATLEHLFSCFDTTYQVLGASAPNLTDDAYVVRTYEAARAMGDVALSLRTILLDAPRTPVEALRDVLVESVADDLSGAMLLFCLAMVVGPRLMVSLRDAREFEEFDADALSVLNEASAVVLAEILAIGAVAKSQGTIDDEHWQEQARGLARHLEEAGYADSFGISH
jgi:RecA/RadA recombinase